MLRDVAKASPSALLAGMRASELAIVSGCIAAGAEGPSFWPWTMSGPNAHAGNLVRSFYDYHHLDRQMKAGELVRMDIGCDLGHYEGDVGRTVPVSGAFSTEQAEAWDLLISAYRAGLAVMKAGVTPTRSSPRRADARCAERSPRSRASTPDKPRARCSMAAITFGTCTALASTRAKNACRVSKRVRS